MPISSMSLQDESEVRVLVGVLSNASSKQMCWYIGTSPVDALSPVSQRVLTLHPETQRERHHDCGRKKCVVGN